MRFAIASDNESDIAAHTGRCKGFVIYDVVDDGAKRLEYRANSSTAHARGQCSGESGHSAQAGHGGHEGLLDQLADCRALVTRGMGPRLIADLLARDIDPYVCDLESVEEAAGLFAGGRLQRVDGCGPCCHH